MSLVHSRQQKLISSNLKEKYRSTKVDKKPNKNQIVRIVVDRSQETERKTKADLTAWIVDLHIHEVNAEQKTPSVTNVVE